MTEIKGVPAMVVAGSLLRTARIRDEWFVDVEAPDVIVDALKQGQYGRVHLFSFWQRLPSLEPRFGYYRETEWIAALPLSSYEEWWQRQIDGKTRNLVRKAEKKGISVRVVPFDDDLVHGITRVFNETPVRQGRPFVHFGKTDEQVRGEMADRPEVSRFIGAYLNEELIGFVKLLTLREYVMMVEIISAVEHRDKAPNNALIAAAVKECCQLGSRYLTYSTWAGGSLATFKENNGFQRLAAPRYFVPVSVRGELALRSGIHKGLFAALPDQVRESLRSVRAGWYTKMVAPRRLSR
jgi:hypothetical protein